MPTQSENHHKKLSQVQFTDIETDPERGSNYPLDILANHGNSGLLMTS